jgi:uncharacterized protein with HEPN domain
MDEVDLDLIRDMLRYPEAAIDLLGSADASELSRDVRTDLAVRHALQIVGEAASRISERGRSELPGIPWNKVVGMRHHLVHGYRQVRAEIVVRTIRESLPPLIESLTAALKEEGQ